MAHAWPLSIQARVAQSAELGLMQWHSAKRAQQPKPAPANCRGWPDSGMCTEWCAPEHGSVSGATWPAPLMSGP